MRREQADKFHYTNRVILNDLGWQAEVEPHNFGENSLMAIYNTYTKGGRDAITIHKAELCAALCVLAHYHAHPWTMQDVQIRARQGRLFRRVYDHCKAAAGEEVDSLVAIYEGILKKIEVIYEQ